MLLLLTFPLNLIWGGIIAWFYKPESFRQYIWAPPVILAAVSYFLPPDISLTLWTPNGLITLLVIVAYSLPKIFPVKEDEKIFALEPPPLKLLRDKLKSVDQEKRQDLYRQMVQEYARFLFSKSDAFSQRNTEFFLKGLAVSFAVSFAGLYYWMSAPGALETVIQKTMEELNNSMQMKLTQVIYMSPVLVFISTSVFFYLIMNLLRLVSVIRYGRSIPYGTLVFFNLPQYFVWLFVGAGGIYFLSKFFPSLETFFIFASLNFIVALSILFIFHGNGIVMAFLQARLIASSWVFTGVLLTLLFFPAGFFFLQILFLLIGLFDFFFSFRNKALQPASGI